MNPQNIVLTHPEPSKKIKFLSLMQVRDLMDCCMATAVKRRQDVASHFGKSPLNITREDFNKYYKL